MSSTQQVDAVGKGLVGLKLMTGQVGNPHGGMASDPENKFSTVDRHTTQVNAWGKQKSSCCTLDCLTQLSVQ